MLGLHRPATGSCEAARCLFRCSSPSNLPRPALLRRPALPTCGPLTAGQRVCIGDSIRTVGMLYTQTAHGGTQDGQQACRPTGQCAPATLDAPREPRPGPPSAGRLGLRRFPRLWALGQHSLGGRLFVDLCSRTDRQAASDVSTWSRPSTGGQRTYLEWNISDARNFVCPPRADELHDGVE